MGRFVSWLVGYGSGGGMVSGGAYVGFAGEDMFEGVAPAAHGGGMVVC